MTFEKRFYIHLKTLFPEKSIPPIVIACSGGIDSMVLLDLLVHQNPKPKLTVCHINHNQRKDAHKDAALVKTYCKKHKIDCKVYKLRLPQDSSELTLRQHRYQVLEKMAQTKKAVITTAHHAQDCLETYLFRLLRGSHPETIKGIAPQSKKKYIKMIRPLLQFDKKDLIQYATSHQVPWREDSTNNSLKYARNRIRHLLIPLLEELNPGSPHRILNFFTQLSSQARTPSTHEALHLSSKLTSAEGAPIQKLNFSLLKLTLDQLLADHSRRTTQAHWEGVKRQITLRSLSKKSGGPPKSLQFPGGYTLCFKGNKLFWLNHATLSMKKGS